MPRRNDIESILILGAGPIVIGQACEFDYSGTQACNALREEGYRIVLVNSNPATIMTDPDTAPCTYVDAVEWQTVARIIEKERPQALLPTIGGQTALNCALDLAREGVLKEFSVELIGANKDAIDKAEDRELFAKAMKSIGLKTPRCDIAHNLEDAKRIQAAIGFPCIIRPCFTLGGTGSGIAYNPDQFEQICREGLRRSPTSELLIDESLIGWKEYEMEVIRDREDNCIIVCCIENLDPMGVHTGDSITVAPALTLTDREYQAMRDASIAVLREVGVETGGANVQFGVNPADGELVVIEMNPRVSRSSALASKATGFPIAKVAAKLAVGYLLHELQNSITRVTPASFEPSIDYVVTKIPRFAFEKLPNTNSYLTTQMQSVGEVMAVGRTFQESLQKALRSLETGISGLEPIFSEGEELDDEGWRALRRELRNPNPDRLRYIADAARRNMTIAEIHELTNIDPWFLAQILDLVDEETKVRSLGSLERLDEPRLWRLKRKGFSDHYLARLCAVSEQEMREHRWKLKLHPAYKRVDTCAAEFASETAYLYSTYERLSEANPTDREKIMVLGGGPNRIGQGIEFDYCCVHAAAAMRDHQFETIMVNCNPETVSTDYDISDRLYFEPLTLEDTLEIIRVEKPEGVIVQFGGQTPLKLARELTAAGAPIIGTPADALDRAENRQRFRQLVKKLNLLQPPNHTAYSIGEALETASSIGYPLMVRPSYVLGGRAMELVYSDADLERYMGKTGITSEGPVLLEQFLDDAIEIDIDLVSDGREAVIGGIMQHIEQAGVHSGDSACSLPPYNLSTGLLDRIRQQVRDIALELGVIGLMNAQLAVQGDDIYILEVNPRASRTVPFVSKCIGVSLARIGALCMLAGASLNNLGFTREIFPPCFFVKAPVFPFTKFPHEDPLLGPEMKSTGEVMGYGDDFATAFARAMAAAGDSLPPKSRGQALISVRDSDKPGVLPIARFLLENHYKLYATSGTAAYLNERGLDSVSVHKVGDGHMNIDDLLRSERIDLIINTTAGYQAIKDSAVLRQLALQYEVCYTTTVAGGLAIRQAVERGGGPRVASLQSLHARVPRSGSEASSADLGTGRNSGENSGSPGKFGEDSGKSGGSDQVQAGRSPPETGV